MISKIFNKNIILNIIFCISLPFVTLLTSERATNNELIISLILTFIIGIIFSIKFKNLFKKYNLKTLIFSSILSLYICKVLINYSSTGINAFSTFIHKFLNISLSNENTIFLVSFMVIPALIQIIYILTLKLAPKIKEIYNSMTKSEKYTLVIITVIGFFATLILYNLTNCFYEPVCKQNNEEVFGRVDIIYTTDTGKLFRGNTFLNINLDENDIRQPFFGVFAIPFAIIAYILKDLLFFIPNGYAVFITTIQIFLLALTIFMIFKMLNLKGKHEILFFAFCFSTFPFILFSFIIEQYIFALFYLILAIYVYYFQISKTNYLYIGAVGTLLTSGIIFPLISKFESFKNWIKNLFKCFIAFVGLTIISGQMHVFINIIQEITKLMRFAGQKLLFIDKLKQFLYFVQSIFIAPKSHILADTLPVAYRLDDVNFICLIGIAILILCLISFILNRKNKLALISFLWIIFSFLILCILGWGTAENGLILYSLYFSWAYIVLIYLLIDKLIKNDKIKTILLFAIVIILLFFNIPEFLRIVKFGLTYYRT